MMGKYVQCLLCPKKCVLGLEERGDCRVRINYQGELKTLVYAKPCSMHIDPVEKKPMFHFLPGSTAFSLATAGCNLHCKFCQNWEISQVNPEDTRNESFSPEQLVETALRSGCLSIAYTYSEPIIFYEYTYDSSVLAKRAGIKNILVTAGFINETPWRKLCEVSDAANIDLKSFSDDFYREICGGQLEPILKAIKVAVEMGVMVELTNLIIPTLNDDMEMIKRMCGWILDNIGPEYPLHFSRFFPRYQIQHLPWTPEDTLIQAREIALRQGLYYVYIGNVDVEGTEDTYCPNCKKRLIERKGYWVGEVNLVNGSCKFCGQRIKGVWA